MDDYNDNDRYTTGECEVIKHMRESSDKRTKAEQLKANAGECPPSEGPLVSLEGLL